MATLDWIGKSAVVGHHRAVPYHLLRECPSRSVDPTPPDPAPSTAEPGTGDAAPGPRADGSGASPADHLLVQGDKPK